MMDPGSTAKKPHPSANNGDFMMNTKIRNLLFLLLLLGTAAQAQKTKTASTKSPSTGIKSWNVSQLDSAIRNAKAPTIFNFWATFCKPCIEEIPYFQQLVKKYDSAGVKLVLVSLDFKENYPKKIADFAKKRKFTAPIVFLDETNADVFCPVVDKDWSGVLPA